jgi:large subunit ribosomal protein L32
MAVPKKRKGHSAQGHRRSKWKASVPTTSTCKNCGETKLAHHVCEYCGYYGEKPASKKLEDI